MDDIAAGHKTFEKPEHVPDPMQSAEINELAGALAKAQGEIQAAHKDSNNPFFKSTYADLASVWDACREPLSKNGLAVVQTTKRVETGHILFTTLAHSSGQWIKSELEIKPVKNDPQGIGSAITYARRYALAAIVGVSAKDDDGEASMGRDTEKKPTPTQHKTSPKKTAQKPPSEPEQPLSLQERLVKVAECKATPHVDNVRDKHGKGLLQQEHDVFTQACDKRIEELEKELKAKPKKADSLTQLKSEAYDKRHQLKWEAEHSKRVCVGITGDEKKDEPKHMTEKQLITLHQLLDQKLSEKQDAPF